MGVRKLTEAHKVESEGGWESVCMVKRTLLLVASRAEGDSIIVVVVWNNQKWNFRSLEGVAQRRNIERNFGGCIMLSLLS